MTIEVWIKDLSTTAAATQILFQNSLDGINPLISLAVTAGTLSSSPKTISCIPMSTTTPSLAATLQK